MSTNMVRNNPPIMSAHKNILEHISLMAQEQVQLEFREQMQEMMLMQHDGTMNPNGTTTATNDDKSELKLENLS